jgi:hypothetical protein
MSTGPVPNSSIPPSADPNVPVPPTDVPPALVPVAPIQPPQSPTTYAAQFFPNPMPLTPAKPAKKGNAAVVILSICLGLMVLAAVGGWILYYIKNNALDLANSDIANKTVEIAKLNSDLTAANADIESLNKDLKKSKAETAGYVKQISQLKQYYKCSDISIEDFDFSSPQMMEISLLLYVFTEYGEPGDYDGGYINNYDSTSMVMFVYDQEIFVFVVYYENDSKKDADRIFFANEECFIE